MNITLILKELEQEIEQEGQRQAENLLQGNRFCVADLGNRVFLSESEFKRLYTEGNPLPEEIKQYYSREGYAEHFINAPRVKELIGPVATSDEILLYVTLQFFYFKNSFEEIRFPMK